MAVVDARWVLWSRAPLGRSIPPRLKEWRCARSHSGVRECCRATHTRRAAPTSTDRCRRSFGPVACQRRRENAPPKLGCPRGALLAAAGGWEILPTGSTGLVGTAPARRRPQDPDSSRRRLARRSASSGRCPHARILPSVMHGAASLALPAIAPRPRQGRACRYGPPRTVRFVAESLR